MIWFVIAAAGLVFCHLYFAERSPALSLVMVAILAPLLSQGLATFLVFEQALGAAFVVAVIIVVGEGYTNGSSNDDRGTVHNNAT